MDYEPTRTNLTYHQSYQSSGYSGSYDDYVDAWESAFTQHEQLSAASGIEFHMHEVAAQFCAQLGLSEADAPALAAAYIDDWQANVVPMTGVTGLLNRLARHYRLALITNTHYPPMVHQLIESMQLQGVFEVVFMSVEVGVPKPDAAIFERTLTAMRVSPDQAVYIGDNYEADYLGATRAGMDCYLVGRHARVPRDRQLRSILDLPIYFKTEKK